jgi:NAD(P)-dependent dehydrogenase (short-subunit alcohol dehydrogenase family)
MAASSRFLRDQSQYPFSISGADHGPAQGKTDSSKAALLCMTRTLSGELIGRGIRVNAISPGPIATPHYDKLGLSADDLKTVSASIRSQVPAGRFGGPSEIAKAVVFLASDECRFAVGSELLIDGGMGNL